MPSKIRVLTEQTINQIAAGEVIENPASVVKELVENSIDAGSSEISVEIRAGGRQLIRITDNGCGMSKDDAVLCLERHATSKIRNLDDLNELHTMGFRGEAIPSIASISKMTLLTRPADEDEGTLVIVEGGRMISCASAARSPGTTIEIRSLFFNVPVRKKFQKSPAYDGQEIQKVLNLIALANPGIRFELIDNQEIVFKAMPSANADKLEQLKERIKDVLGAPFINDALPIQLNNDSFNLVGFLGSPFYHRPNRTGQYLFINNRPITSSAISYAVREGYGMTLPPNRYPAFVLYVDLPGNEVDVNVHPQKREVRLSREQQIRELIIRGVENALSAATHPFLQMTTEAVELPAYMPEPIVSEQLPPPISAYSLALQPKRAPIQMDLAPQIEHHPHQPSVKVLAVIQGYVLIDPTCFPKQIAKDGLCLVDPAAAQARIIFESLLAKHEIPESQSLLVPYTIDLPPSEAELLKSRLDDLSLLGLHVREFGTSTFMVDSVPVFLKEADIPKLIKEFVAEFQEFSSSKGLQTDLRRRLALAACKSAKQSQERLNSLSAQMIMDKLVRCENPYQSPFGKPIVVHITPEELAGKFQK